MQGGAPAELILTTRDEISGVVYTRAFCRRSG
jgi:hypothetical protein